MNVKDLKEVLKGLPEDMPVFLSSDAEGNRYEKLYSYDVCLVCPDDNEPLDLEPDQTESGEIKALYLWP